MSFTKYQSRRSLKASKLNNVIKASKQYSDEQHCQTYLSKMTSICCSQTLDQISQSNQPEPRQTQVLVLNKPLNQTIKAILPHSNFFHFTYERANTKNLFERIEAYFKKQFNNKKEIEQSIFQIQKECQNYFYQVYLISISQIEKESSDQDDQQSQQYHYLLGKITLKVQESPSSGQTTLSIDNFDLQQKKQLGKRFSFLKLVKCFKEKKEKLYLLPSRFGSVISPKIVVQCKQKEIIEAIKNELQKSLKQKKIKQHHDVEMKYQYQLLETNYYQLIGQLHVFLKVHNQKNLEEYIDMQTKILWKLPVKEHSECIIVPFSQHKSYDGSNKKPLEQIWQSIKQEDFSCPSKDEKMVEQLSLVTKLSYMMPPTVRETVKAIADKIKFISEKMPYYEFLYRVLQKVVKKMQKQYEYKGRQRDEMSYTNKLFIFFCQQYQSRPRKNMPYMVMNKESNKQMSLSVMIAEIQKFFTYKWHQIYECVQHVINEANLKEESPQNKFIKHLIKRRIYESEILDYPCMDVSCLGCVPYFVMNWNIYDISTNKTTLALIDNSYHFLEKDENNKQKVKHQLRKQMCGLLNTKGGVILFDCERSYLKIIPRGAFLIERQVKYIKQQIRQVAKSIEPSPIEGQNYEIDFVPLAKEPLINFDIDTKKMQDLVFFQSLVVIRIKIRPTIKNKQYIYQTSNGYQICRRYASIHSDPKSFSRASADKKQQQKIKSEIDWIDSMLDEAVTCFDHDKCKPCRKVRILEKRQKQTQRTVDFENKYQYASAMVVKKQLVNQVKRRLQKYMTDFELVAPFIHLNLKGAAATCILYHNIPFNEVYSIISYNPDFHFDNRNTVVVVITNYIKFADRTAYKVDKSDTNRDGQVGGQQTVENKKSLALPLAEFDALKTWARNEFNGQQLQVKQFYQEKKGQGQAQMFMKIVNKKGKVNKACTLLLYLVLNHHKQKSLLKDPKDQPSLKLYDYSNPPLMKSQSSEVSQGDKQIQIEQYSNCSQANEIEDREKYNSQKLFQEEKKQISLQLQETFELIYEKDEVIKIKKLFPSLQNFSEMKPLTNHKQRDPFRKVFQQMKKQYYHD